MTYALEEETPKRLGNTKVTREDWLAKALEVLVAQGVDKVRVMTLGEALGVSRSSFYWYFKDRKELLTALLTVWDHSNTAAIVGHTQMPAKTISEAVLNLFRCYITQSHFDHQLDFAIRAWGRRNQSVQEVVEEADALRLDAIKTMYERFGYSSLNATVRARVLYYMQLGYYMMDLNESLESRLELTPQYIESATGRFPSEAELEVYLAQARAVPDDPPEIRYLKFIRQAEGGGDLT